ncbi:MAG: hypothetical protein JRH10_22180 [Deltaproteobacteria bacterium]|nr:hypothetical protein [Deltaproteobacteria bacterium]
MYARVALRDVGLLAGALVIWGVDASLRGGEGVAPFAVGLLAGVLAGLCAYLAHEWGHLLGARLGGAVVHPPSRVATVFLFNFDSDANGPREFVWMSCGGFALSLVGLVFVLTALPFDAVSGRVALTVTMLGVLATAVLELPPFFRVLRGGAIPRGLGYRTADS